MGTDQSSGLRGACPIQTEVPDDPAAAAPSAKVDGSQQAIGPAGRAQRDGDCQTLQTERPSMYRPDADPGRKVCQDHMTHPRVDRVGQSAARRAPTDQCWNPD